MSIQQRPSAVLASKLQETNLEHQQLHTAQERQLQLEAQALRQAQIEEQQAAATTREHELAIQEFKRQAEEQPELLKIQGRHQLSQQSSYKAEMHELYTEMLNMREKSEMKSHLSAQMCRLETPSRSVESEPENVLNTASPGRCSSWILPSEMMSTPDRQTSSGLQSPSGSSNAVWSKSTYSRVSSSKSMLCTSSSMGKSLCSIAREPGEEECELFGDILPGQEEILPEEPAQHEAHQDEQRFQVLLMTFLLMYRVQDASMVSL